MSRIIIHKEEDVMTETKIITIGDDSNAAPVRACEECAKGQINGIVVAHELTMVAEPEGAHSFCQICESFDDSVEVVTIAPGKFERADLHMDRNGDVFVKWRRISYREEESPLEQHRSPSTTSIAPIQTYHDAGGGLS